jgi:BioD-like phosphotransacetylase family protein
VGYYKPFSQSRGDDPDVVFVYRELLGSREGLDVPRPHAIPETSVAPLIPEGVGQEIKATVDQLNVTHDLVLVDGPDLYTPEGQVSLLASELVSRLNSRVLLLFRYTKDLDANAVAGATEPLQDRLAGVVINGVSAYRRREVDQSLLEGLRQQGIPVLGMLPEDRTMLSVTVRQVADYLGGAWAQEPVNTDAYIDRFLIGANIMDAGETYFGRFEHQAVIARAERPDIQMASLMAATRCLILTGGNEPIDYIKAEALQREVPVILVQGDTLTTAEALGGLLEQANIHSLQKIQRFSQLVQQHLDLPALDAALI